MSLYYAYFAKKQAAMENAEKSLKPQPSDGKVPKVDNPYQSGWSIGGIAGGVIGGAMGGLGRLWK